MGLVHDLRARISIARTYFWNKVKAARNLIYNVGLAISNARINSILQEFSLVPTIVSIYISMVFCLRSTLTNSQNAFAERLGPFGFDFHPMLVVDHLHEWSLGVWKATFCHIVRVLYAAVGEEAVNEMNLRYVISAGTRP